MVEKRRYVISFTAEMPFGMAFGPWDLHKTAEFLNDRFGFSHISDVQIEQAQPPTWGGGLWVKTTAGAEAFLRVPKGFAATVAQTYHNSCIRHSRDDADLNVNYIFTEWAGMHEKYQTMAIRAAEDLLGFLVGTGHLQIPAGTPPNRLPDAGELAKTFYERIREHRTTDSLGRMIEWSWLGATDRRPLIAAAQDVLGYLRGKEFDGPAAE